VKRRIAAVLVIACSFALGGCAAYRSDIGGAYHGEKRLNQGAGKVSVAFIFTHARQTKGWDAIPKLDEDYRIIHGFNDFLGDALPEITNIRSYDTFTEKAGDVNNPVRRSDRNMLMTNNDYVIRMRFNRETSFAQQTLGSIVSTVTVTLFPMPYTRKYSVTADVYGPGEKLIKRYDRHATVTEWVETFLILAYPFHPEVRKTEEVYVEFLHDIFREIEADRILTAER
jgi:hypothetical protein